MFKLISLFWLAFSSGGVMAESAIAQADRSVVRVIVKVAEGYQSGTGFVVGPGGIVVTNNHVIAGSDGIVVLVKHDGSKPEKLSATVTWASPDYDLAILQVNGLGSPPLTLFDQLPNKGSQVTAIGYPGVADRQDQNANNLVESTVTQGIIGRVVRSSWRRGGEQLSILQHGAAVNSGNSGGPLLDVCGRVVGVNTAKALGRIEGNASDGLQFNQSDGIFFASHVEVLLNALKKQGVQVSVSSQACPPSGPATEAAPPAPGLAPVAQRDWVLSTGIGMAILIAIGALLMAMKKTTVARETFTEYRRRTVPVPVVQNAKAQVPAKAPVWLLNGRGSLNQTLELRLDAGQLNARAQVVGRDGSQCDLSVNDPTVSRRHASICWTAGEFQLTDLGSTNGTWLDDQPVKQKMVTLRVGQTLTLGKVIFNVQGPMP